MKYSKTLLLFVVLLILGAVAIVLQGPARRDRVREKALVFPDLDTKEVWSIRIRRPEGELLLSRREASGWVVGEAQHPADSEAVGNLLQGLVDLRETAVASTNPERQSLFKVDDEQGLTVRLASDEDRALAEFVVGSQGQDFFSGYLRLPGEDRVLLVSSNLKGVFGRSLEGWRDKEIVRVGRDEVTAVTIETDGVTLNLDRSAGGEWQVNGREADQKEVGDYLDRVASIRAVGFAEAEEEARAGLDQPVANIALSTGEKTIRITVGALKEGDNQHFLRTDRSEIVYLVGKYVADFLVRKEADFPLPPDEKKEEAPPGEG